MNLEEFYYKYWKIDGKSPVPRLSDEYFFKLYEKALKEGKKIALLKSRPPKN